MHVQIVYDITAKLWIFPFPSAAIFLSFIKNASHEGDKISGEVRVHLAEMLEVYGNAQ